MIFLEAQMVAATKQKPKAALPPSHKKADRKANPINAEYEAEAKRILREMCNADYEDLAERLNAMGVEISARGLENKISRGGFSATFLLQCMDALGVKQFRK